MLDFLDILWFSQKNVSNFIMSTYVDFINSIQKMYLLSFNMLQEVHPLFVFLYDFLVFYSLWEMEHYFRAGSRGAFDLHRVLLSII